MGQAQRHLVVDGVRTHYLEAGDGPVVLLLHGGAWGECAQTAWEPTVGPLAAAGYRVIAPDWIGFGRSDKIRDFGDLAGRQLAVLARVLETLDVRRCAAVGLSMGGAHLLRDLTSDRPHLPVSRLVLVSAGGPPLAGDTRRRLMDYDGTLESMRRQVALAFADPAWAADPDFVRRRHEMSLLPGAYEWFASLVLRAPAAAAPPEEDGTRYERIGVPVLVTAGTADRLKPAGYAERVAERIPGARLRLFAGAGHCPQIEAAAEWNGAVLDFLAQPSADQPTSEEAAR